MASVKSLKSDLAAMLKEDSTSDIVIKCEDQELQAHKLILCARSPVFKAMFQSDMVEEIKNEVCVKEARMSVVKQMVNFIYTEELQESFKEFRDLLVLADQYDIEDLVIHCGNELVKHEPITAENVVNLGVFGEKHNCDVLVTKCVEFFARNMEASLAEDWTDQIKSSSKFMINILKMLKLHQNTMKQKNLQPPNSRQIVRVGNYDLTYMDYSAGTIHALDFEANRKVWLHGIGLYGEYNNPNAALNVKIKVFVKDEQKVEMDRIYKGGDSSRDYIGDVMMSSLVEIEPHRRCSVIVEWITGGRTYRGFDPKPEVTSTGPGPTFKVKLFPKSVLARQLDTVGDNIPILYLMTV